MSLHKRLLCGLLSLLVMTINMGLIFLNGAFADSELYELTANCGSTSCLYNSEVREYWKPESEDSCVTVSINPNRVAYGIYIAWYSPYTKYKISVKNLLGTELICYESTGEICYEKIYSLPESAKTIVISVPVAEESKKYGIIQLSVLEKNVPNKVARDWEKPKEQTDILFVPAHQDDEHLFLGGVIPYFMNEGRSIQVAFSVNCGRLRVAASLKGLWDSGYRISPDFLYLSDKRTLEIDETIQLWGGDETAIVTKFVRLIRKRKPKIIITHDENGENGHGQHKATAYMLKKAFTLAADTTFDVESVDKLGVWQAKKLYLHLYSENVVQLDYDKKLDKFGKRTALEVSAMGFDAHTTQKEFYSVTRGGKYDNSIYGLCMSVVGYDDIDMFYNIDGEGYEKVKIKAVSEAYTVTAVDGDFPGNPNTPIPTAALDTPKTSSEAESTPAFSDTALPMDTPVFSSEASVCDSPVATPVLDIEHTFAKDPRFIIGAGLMFFAILCGGYWFAFGRKRKKSGICKPKR